jgi:tryptophan synthase alpha chain
MSGIEKIKHAFVKNKIFAAYLTAGDGGMDKTYAAAKALIEGGVNLLEIGVPFSDPIADGPVIQHAAERSLKQGTTLQEVLEVSKKIHQDYPDVPLILFSYFNPILSVLKKDFFKQAAQSGIDGALIVDCPLEEADDFHQACMKADIAPIYILTPSTPIERIKKIDAAGEGFLYYACRKGTTGVKSALPDDFVQKMQQIKSYAKLPILAGFGISQRDTAQAVLEHADGVVVGSLFVKTYAEGASMEALKELAKTIRPF